MKQSADKASRKGRKPSVEDLPPEFDDAVQSLLAYRPKAETTAKRLAERVHRVERKLAAPIKKALGLSVSE